MFYTLKYKCIFLQPLLELCLVIWCTPNAHLNKRNKVNLLKTFQNKSFSFLFFLGVFAAKLAIAHSNEPIYQICCPCQYKGATLGATLLYLKPNVDDTHYVISSFDNTFMGSLYPNGERHQNIASFTPGFRLEGFYDIDPGTSCLDMRFTFFNARSTDSVSGGFLFDTNGFPGFGAQDSPVYAGMAGSNISYNFYAGDITYDRALCFFCDDLKFIVGLHGAYIKFKEHTNSSGTFLNNDVETPLLNNLYSNSEFYGIGPQIGLDYRFLASNIPCLSGILAFTVKARGALLGGNTRSDLSYITLRTGPGGVRVSNGDLWRVIPTANTGFGINYTFDCGCCEATLELGYEFMWYGNCINQIRGVDVAFAGDTIDVFNSFTLHGPYLSVRVIF